MEFYLLCYITLAPAWDPKKHVESIFFLCAPVHTLYIIQSVITAEQVH